MKRLLVSVVFIGFILSAGCATCPKQDVLDMVMTPFGPVIIKTEKGCYTEDRHSIEKFLALEGWVTVEEYDAYVEELRKKVRETLEREKAI